MSNSHMSSVLYEAECMASSCSFFQWLLLGHLRVRCRTMSDMSFMSGVRCAVSKNVLQVCYHSQTFRFIPRDKQEHLYNDWPALLITVHNLSLETQASFIRRCIARSNLKPMVRNIQMGREIYGRDHIIRQYCDVFSHEWEIIQTFAKDISALAREGQPVAFHIDSHPLRYRFTFIMHPWTLKHKLKEIH